MQTAGRRSATAAKVRTCCLGLAPDLFNASDVGALMIAVVQGSNRRGNSTLPFAQLITEIIADAGEVSTLIDLEYLPGEILHAGMYTPGLENHFLAAAEATLKQSDRWFFVFPEYNGSFPGALKLFIDALSVRDYAGIFSGKTAALVGTASGRSGNVRGLDHFTAVLQHMGTNVIPGSLPISLIDGLLGGVPPEVTDQATIETVRKYVGRLMEAQSVVA